jgi:hypothetical protein
LKVAKQEEARKRIKKKKKNSRKDYETEKDWETGLQGRKRPSPHLRVLCTVEMSPGPCYCSVCGN